MAHRMSCLACLLCFTAIALAAPGDGKIVEKETKTSFEATLSGADGATLTCTGAGCRKKTAFNAKVYALAHWIDAAGAAEALAQWKGRPAKELVGDQSFYDALATTDVQKRLRLVFVRNVSGKQVREGFDESLPDTAEATQFLAMFQADIKKKEVLEIRWLPGGTIEVHEKGKRVGAVEDKPEFAADVWRMYMGPKLVDGHLETVKKELLSDVEALWAE